MLVAYLVGTIYCGGEVCFVFYLSSGMGGDSGTDAEQEAVQHEEIEPIAAQRPLDLAQQEREAVAKPSDVAIDLRHVGRFPKSCLHLPHPFALASSISSSSLSDPTESSSRASGKSRGV